MKSHNIDKIENISKHSVVIQIKARTFITGGISASGEKSHNEVWEYSEKDKKNIKRLSMKYKRDSHCCVKISDHNFVVIGGFSSKKVMKSCEVYTTDESEEKWEIAKKLINKIKSATASLLNNSDLYVVGRNNGQIKIERNCILDLFKSDWTVISLVEKIEIEKQSKYPLISFPISGTEILIFNEKSLNTGVIWNSVNRPISKIKTDYKKNKSKKISVTILNGIAYLVSYDGEVKRFKIPERRFIN